jgi:hypothetical protein
MKEPCQSGALPFQVAIGKRTYGIDDRILAGVTGGAFLEQLMEQVCVHGGS